MIAKELRDQIAVMLDAEFPEGSDDGVLPCTRKLNEEGKTNILFIDAEATCFRITVEVI